MSTTDRISYDTDISAEVQSEVTVVIGRLEALLALRDSHVASAMADFRADGISEEYHAVERRWRQASEEVRDIIALVRTVLQRNDQTAASTVSRARAAVLNIG